MRADDGQAGQFAGDIVEMDGSHVVAVDVVPGRAVGDDAEVEETRHAEFAGFFVEREVAGMVISVGRSDEFYAPEALVVELLQVICGHEVKVETDEGDEEVGIFFRGVEDGFVVAGDARGL